MTERIILKGPAKMLRGTITQIMALHQMIHDRDFGEFVGHSMNEHVRAKPQDLKLKVLFCNAKSPPWRPPQGTERVRATYNVPFISRAKLSWTAIKTACGGADGYTWGRYRCMANITDDDGNIRQMQVYGSSENEAERRLKALLQLSDGKIVTLDTTEEKKEGRRAADKLMYKESTQVYPAYFTIVNSEKIISESHNATLNGNYYRHRGRVPLWLETEPTDADEIIRETLRVRGSSTAAG